TLFHEYKSPTPSKFMIIPPALGFPPAVALDGRKLGEVKKAVAEGKATDDQKKVQESDIKGDRRTLVADSFIPATMAVIYLGLLAYFASIGGYKPVNIDGSGTDLGTGES